VASDLPVLREVGGPSVKYCQAGDDEAWAWAVLDLVRERFERPDTSAARRQSSVAWARRFSWAHFASQLAGIYRELAGAPPVESHRSEACPA
jgi:glycosyltransferase involved in cell wall biosynthesis